MADTKISDLSAVTSVLSTDELVMARSGATNKVDGIFLPGFELDYAQVTADFSVTATTEAGAADVVSLPARSYNGSTIVLIEFYCARCVTGGTAAAAITVNLWDASTDLGRISWVQTPSGASTIAPIHAAVRLTPSNASHTYKARAWRTTANGTLAATSPVAPMFLRATVVL